MQVSDLIASSIKNGSAAVDDDATDANPTTTTATTTAAGTKSGSSGKRRSKGSKSAIEGITLDRVENYSALSKRELEVRCILSPACMLCI